MDYNIECDVNLPLHYINAFDIYPGGIFNFAKTISRFLNLSADNNLTGYLSIFGVYKAFVFCYSSLLLGLFWVIFFEKSWTSYYSFNEFFKSSIYSNTEPTIF